MSLSTQLAAAYWLGNTSSVWTDQNWASDSSGTPTTLTPTSATDVTFSATGAANETTTLGADITIKSLTINDPNAVTIGGANTLTISGSTGTTGITVNSGAGLFTISSNLVLAGSSQTISVNNAAGAIISGTISGTIGLIKTGAGMLTLTGANDYTGGTLFGNTGDLTAGTLEIGDGATDGSTPATPTAITPFGLLTGASGGAVTVNAPTTLTTDGTATGNSYSIANPFFLNPPLTVNVPTATSLTMTGEIFGSDGLTVNGGGATTGTLILSGDNGAGTFDNSGGATTGQGNIYQGATLVQGGTLQAATGSGTGNAFSPNSAFTLNNGSTLDLNGLNETILSLASSDSTTIVTTSTGPATLSINAQHTAGPTTFAGNLTDGAGAGDSLSVGLFSGTVLTLSGSNAYTGTTHVSGSSTLQAGASDANALSPNSAFDVNGVLDLNGNALETIGSLESGAPVTATTVTNTAADTTAILSTNLGNATTPTNPSTTFDGDIVNGASGTGIVGLTKNGTGTLTLGPTVGSGNTYSGPTTVNAGTLQAATTSAFSLNSDYTLTGTSTLDLNGNSNTIASLAGAVATTTVTNNGAANAILTVDDTNSSLLPKTYTYAGLISDGTTNTLGLIKTGTGALTLTHANLYSGGTTINGGTLVVGNATALGIVGALGGTGNVTNNATLETTASSPLATAPLTIIVAGAYTQTTGTLLLQVAADQGHAPTTSAVAGTDYDTLAATGTAAINGGTLDLNFEAGVASHAGQRFQLVSSAAGPVTPIPPTISVTLTGTPFLGITTYNDSFGGTYAANNVVVTLIQGFSMFAGLTPNQHNVAGNIDGNVATLNNNGSLVTPTGATADFFNNIVTGLNTSISNGTLGQSLDQLSPQRYEILHNVAFDNYAFDVQSLDDQLARERTGAGGIDTSGFVLNNSQIGPELSQVRSRLLAWSPAPEHGLLSDSTSTVLGGVEILDKKTMKEAAPQPPENAWNTFVDGGVDLGDLDHNVDDSHSSYTTGRVRLGTDYRVCTDLRVGALFGYSHTDADLDNEGSKAHIYSYTPGIYATYADQDGFYANGLFTYTRNDYSTDRDIVIPGVNRTATGSPSGNQFGGDLDGGYEFHSGNWIVGPSAGLTYVNLGIDSFNEAGAGAASLAVNSQSAESLRSRLGGTVRYQAKVGSVILTPHMSAFWQHEFLDNTANITSQFEGLPGGAFSVQTVKGDSDNALLGAGLDAELNKTVTLFIDYQAEAGGSSFFGQSATGGLKIGF